MSSMRIDTQIGGTLIGPLFFERIYYIFIRTETFSLLLSKTL